MPADTGSPYNLPFPLGSEVADGPAAIQALAVAVAAGLTGYEQHSVTATLPNTGTAGQIVHWKPSTSDPIWDMQWSSAANAWLCTGGPFREIVGSNALGPTYGSAWFTPSDCFYDGPKWGVWEIFGTLTIEGTNADHVANLFPTYSTSSDSGFVPVTRLSKDLIHNGDVRTMCGHRIVGNVSGKLRWRINVDAPGYGPSSNFTAIAMLVKPVSIPPQ